MTHLVSLKDRLDNPHLSKMEQAQRGVFTDELKNLPFPSTATALSVSVGDGIWDYIAFKSNGRIKKIVATDIVNNPVKSTDIDFLRENGLWEFKKVEAEKKLPFKDNSFDLIFHHDVIEHVKKPYLFLSEQYRVLKKGGSIVFGTPNIHRPANIFKLLLGKLYFPYNIGSNDEIGDYIHIQEFYKEQLMVMLEEIGFTRCTPRHCYFGLYFLNITFSLFPSNSIGKSLCHYLILSAQK